MEKLMDKDMCLYFNDVSYPCYWLDEETGQLFMNEAAKQKGHPFDDEAFMRKIIVEESKAAPHSVESQARRARMPAGLLSLQEFTVMPLEGGILCVVTVPRDEATLNFSQQIREPLSEIFSVLPSLAHDKDKKDMVLLESVQSKCYRLLRITCNIENMSLLEKGSYKTQYIDFGEFIEDICESADLLCRKTSVPINTNVSCSNMIINANSYLLDEAVLNILRNSFQYGRDGNEINVSLKPVGGNALLTISDKGLGIKNEYIENVFNPYFSVDPYGDDPEKPGLGLGLTVAKMMVQNLGGTITIESVFGEGTTVSMSLPLAKKFSMDNILESDSAVYVSNRYSSMYIHLEGFSRQPELG